LEPRTQPRFDVLPAKRVFDFFIFLRFFDTPSTGSQDFPFDGGGRTRRSPPPAYKKIKKSANLYQISLKRTG
jgi:hypothetical protein